MESVDVMGDTIEGSFTEAEMAWKSETTIKEFPAIIDLSGYTEKMRKSFLDKTFFLEKIDATVFVDYGCADGSMIEFMWKIFPEYKYFGYDNDEKMIGLAKKRQLSNVMFSSDYDSLMKMVAKETGKKALIASSVLHEIYANYREREEFWKRAFSTYYPFDYIVIRDMCVTQETKNSVINSDVIWDITKYYLTNKDDAYILNDFIEKYGKINTEEQLIHFLLKYRYKNNWQRELNENYLPFTLEELMGMFDKHPYTRLYANHFCLPWLHHKVKKDFGILLTRGTHVKLIYMKNSGTQK